MWQIGNQQRKRLKKIPYSAILVICIVGALTVQLRANGLINPNKPKIQHIFSDDFKFNQSKAFELVKKQVDLGPRYPGSTGIERVRRLIRTEFLNQQDWSVNYQNFSKIWIDNRNITIVNVICTPKDFNDSGEPFILLAHYDTRLWADADPDPQKRTLPVPGANDGASGVAVGLEIGRVLVKYNITNFMLLFVDAEDQGNIGGWDWILGSTHFVESEEFSRFDFSFGILLDMVGAKGATFLRERNSDTHSKDLVDTVWSTAHVLGYSDYFLNVTGRSIKDDHIPFLNKGIPVIDIIDDFSIRYKSWHTTSDDLSQISPVTLGVVGQTLEAVLVQNLNATRFTYQSPFLTFGSDILLGMSILITLFSLKKGRKSDEK